MGTCASRNALPPSSNNDKVYATIWKTELANTRDVRFDLMHVRSHTEAQYKLLKLLSILKSLGYTLERCKDTLCCTMLVKDIARMKMRCHDVPMMTIKWTDFSSV